MAITCKYKTAVEIETLDFVECIEILEENGLPYQGTEEIEDLRKTIINLLPKIDSETKINIDDSTDSQTKEKTDENTSSEAKQELEENTVLMLEPKPGNSTLSETELSLLKDTDSESEAKGEKYAISEIYSSLDNLDLVNANLESKPEEKSEEHTFSEMELSLIKDTDSETEAKSEEDTFSEMELSLVKDTESETVAKSEEHTVSDMEEEKEVSSTVCEKEPALHDDTFSEMETDTIKPKSCSSSVEDSTEMVSQPPSPELMEEEEEEEDLHSSVKDKISGKYQLVQATKTFGVALDELVSRAPPGSTVPVFVSKVLDHIVSREYNEHLFVRKGQKHVVEKLKNSFDAYGDAELEQDLDILAVGQLLQEFLQELPKPIFPTEVIPDLEKPLDDDNELGGGFRLASALLVLPQSHWHLLQFLAKSIQRIVMPGQSLSAIAAAIVPALTRPRVKARSWDGKILTRVLVSCIVNTQDIFKEDIETTREALEKLERTHMAYQIEHIALKRGRFRRPKSTITQPIQGPSGGSIPTEQSEGSSDQTPIVIDEDILSSKNQLSELRKFLKEGSTEDFKRLIETPEYSLPRKKPLKTYGDVIIVDDQEKDVHSDEEAEDSEFSDGSSTSSQYTDTTMEDCTPAAGEQVTMATVQGSTEERPELAGESGSHGLTEPIDLTESSTMSDQIFETMTLRAGGPSRVRYTDVAQSGKVHPKPYAGSISSDKGDNLDVDPDVTILPTLPDDIEITRVEPAPIPQPKSEAEPQSGNFSQSISGHEQFLKPFVASDDLSITIADPRNKTSVLAEPLDVPNDATGIKDVSKTVSEPDKISKPDAELDDESETVTLSGPADELPSVTGPANVLPNVSGPADVLPSVTGPADVFPSVTGPATVPDHLPENVAGSGNVPNTAISPGNAMQVVQTEGQVSASTSGDTANQPDTAVDDMEIVDKELDPEGTEKMDVSEFMELLNTPKRWELVRTYIDPVAIYDSLCDNSVITDKEYYLITKRFPSKLDRTENIRSTINDNKEDRIYVDEAITFIQNSRRTLYMKKILHADDETLKKMLEERNPKNLSAKLREQNRRGQRLLFSFLGKRSKAGEDPSGAGTSDDSEKRTYDVAKFIEAVKEGHDADLEPFKALFQNREVEFEDLTMNPLLVLAAFGSSKAVEYAQRWESSTTVNWDKHMEIKLGVFGGILDQMDNKKVTPLYVATFLKKLATVKSVIKYSDEKNIVYCMNNLPLSNSMEEAYMSEIGERLKSEYSNLKPAVVPGHQKEDGSWCRVYVVYSPDVWRASNHVKEGIGIVMLRNPYKVDDEARTVSLKKDELCEISKEDMTRTKQAIVSHGSVLWCNHSNLNIISVCSVRSKQKGNVLERNLCIVLYCSTKGVVPLGEEEFPTKLTIGEGEFIDTDVREGYFEYGGYDTRPSTSHHTTLKMGCSIGAMTSPIQNGGGTLGPFVLYDGTMSFLTCAHVLFDVATQNTIDFTHNGFNGIAVAQPAPGSPFSTGTACGFVQRAIFNPGLKSSIDVAVVAISDSTRRPIKGRFAMDHSYKYTNAGFKELPEYNNGSAVYDIQEFGTSNMVVQFGSETHLTKGALTVDGTQVRPLSTVLGLPTSNEKFCMSSQYEVEGLKSSVSFFQPGDSGSAVFMLDKTMLHCIGMAIGHMSNGNAVVTPIGALINALGTQRCSIAKFEISPPQRTAGNIKKRYKKMEVNRQRLKSIKKK